MELRWLHLSTRCTREQRLPGFVTCPSQHKTCVLSRNTVTPVGTCDIYFSWISCKMTLRHRLVVVPFACQVSLSCPVLLRRCGSLPGGGGSLWGPEQGVAMVRESMCECEAGASEQNTKQIHNTIKGYSEGPSRGHIPPLGPPPTPPPPADRRLTAQRACVCAFPPLPPPATSPTRHSRPEPSAPGSKARSHLFPRVSAQTVASRA